MSELSLAGVRSNLRVSASLDSTTLRQGKHGKHGKQRMRAYNAVNDFGCTAARVLGKKNYIVRSLAASPAPVRPNPRFSTPLMDTRPHGWKFWVLFASICSCTFLTGLDVVSFPNLFQIPRLNLFSFLLQRLQ